MGANCESVITVMDPSLGQGVSNGAVSGTGKIWEKFVGGGLAQSATPFCNERFRAVHEGL